MKKSNLLLLIFAAFMITFASCTKEEISQNETTEIPTDIDEDTYNPLLDNIENRDDIEDGLNLGCFSIDTPFSLDVDGTVVEINTFEDLENAFNFDSTDVAVNVDFVYPISITYEDGETADVADGEALGEAFAQCIPDEGWVESDTLGNEGVFPAFLICELNSCYQLVYPVTLEALDGTTYDANNEDELIELLSTEDFLEFVFPIDLEGENGTVTATSGDELFDLLLECQDEPWDGGGDVDIDSTFNIGAIACYDIAFPATFEGVDGAEVIINNYEELTAALLNGTIGNFVYPITLTNIETGETIVVNNDGEFEEALEDCWEGDNGGGDVDPPVGGEALFFFLASDDFDNDCYSVNYPVDVITADSTQVTYDSVDDVNNALETGVNIPSDLVYPVSATLISTGETVTLEGAEDIFALLEDCQ